MSFHPYLAFQGTCREAFTHYQKVFGGELMIVTAADVPPEVDMTGTDPNMVLHAALVVGDGLLMGGDMPGNDQPVSQGMCANYSAVDVPDAEKVFAGLSEGGQVTMPLEVAFFSPAFGMCVDRFGTPWMVVAPGPEMPAS
jgi:PhnB protein